LIGKDMGFGISGWVLGIGRQEEGRQITSSLG